MKSPISSPLKSALCCAGLAAIAAIVLIFNISTRPTPDELTEIRGRLQEWSTGGSSRDPLLRVKLDSTVADLQLDPKYFRGILEQKIPEYFRRGDPVVILAKRPDIGIVWIRGMSIDGRELIRPEAITAIDSEDDLWGYAMIAVSMAGFAWFMFKSRRNS